MSVTNNILHNNNHCCRSCTGNICASYAIDTVNYDNSVFTIKGVEGPTITKQCDKGLSDEAENKLSIDLGNKLYDTIMAKLTAMSTIGYLERGRIYKICASFSIRVCVDNGEAFTEIKEFKVHTFA